jgi:cbb3-type cytochrome oxidase subunit 3
VSINLNGLGGLPAWALVVFALCFLFWIGTVLRVAREKTRDPFDRIVWLLIVLLLNVVGAIIYVLYGPRSGDQSSQLQVASEGETRNSNDSA